MTKIKHTHCTLLNDITKTSPPKHMENILCFEGAEAQDQAVQRGWGVSFSEHFDPGQPDVGDPALIGVWTTNL